MKKNKTPWKDLLFMLKLSTACAILLLITKASVGERAELSIRTADSILQILGKETLPSEEIAIENFSNLFVSLQRGNIKIWRYVDKPYLWACEATGNGMWGSITLTYVVNSYNWKILGLKVVEQKETVGLGARISEDDFGNKFIGINAENGVKSVPIKVMNNEFDAISGATVSSKSIEKIVNKSLLAIRKHIK